MYRVERPVVSTVGEGVNDGRQVLNSGGANGGIGSHDDKGLGREDEFPEGVSLLYDGKQTGEQVQALRGGGEIREEHAGLVWGQGHSLVSGLHAAGGGRRQVHLEQVAHQVQLQGVARHRQRPPVHVLAGSLKARRVAAAAAVEKLSGNGGSYLQQITIH